MAGRQPTDSLVDREAPARAVLCLADSAPLGGVLADAGYDVVTVGTMSDVAGAVDAHEVGVLLFDSSSPEWLRSVSDVRRQRPGLCLVLIGELDNPEEFLAAVGGGVDGFCSSDASAEAVLRTVRSVESQGIAIPRSMVSTLVEHVRHGRGRTVHAAGGPVEVTDREWDVIEQLFQRRTTREMSQALFVSDGTIRSHISALLRKFGAVDRDDLVAMIERGRS